MYHPNPTSRTDSQNLNATYMTNIMLIVRYIINYKN
mgnify:CR=1 FL=1